VDSEGLAVSPTSSAENDVDFINQININKDQLDSSKTSVITSKGDQIDIFSMLTKLHLYANTFTEGAAGGATVSANSRNKPKLKAIIHLDNTSLSAPNGGVHLLASMDKDAGKDGTFYEEHANACSYTPLGSEYALARIEDGEIYAWILCSDTSLVKVDGEFTHEAAAAGTNNYNAECTGSAAVWTTVDDQHYTIEDHCDFCNNDPDNPDGPNHSDDPDDPDNPGYFRKYINKALAPILEIRKAFNGGLDSAQGGIYALGRHKLLTEDMMLTEEKLKKYTLWTNTLTQHEAILLPNATRLYRKKGLDYIAEIFRGDIPQNGMENTIVIFTALNENAFRNPVIPIGETGSLDFRTGSFTMPVSARFDLYLFEISGAWLMTGLKDGKIRMLAADPEAVNGYMAENGEKDIAELPLGDVLEGITEEKTGGGWRLFWLGHTPETAADENEPLIFLRWNETTDEILAFRTSVAEIASGVVPTEVSLYIWRDGERDRAGEEKYNVMFYDTPAGEKSRVKVITHALDGREPELQSALQIVLRSSEVSGADLPAYSLAGHCFVMNDGTDGKVSVFDDEYTASFNGDVFESNYIRIEGIRENNLNVTIWKGQPVWEEADDFDDSVHLSKAGGI
jgi:hypothetical protein